MFCPRGEITPTRIVSHWWRDRVEILNAISPHTAFLLCRAWPCGSTAARLSASQVRRGALLNVFKISATPPSCASRSTSVRWSPKLSTSRFLPTIMFTEEHGGVHLRQPLAAPYRSRPARVPQARSHTLCATTIPQPRATSHNFKKWHGSHNHAGTESNWYTT